MNLQKQPTILSQKLTQSAKGEDCTLNTHACNHNPETTVLCHLNESWAGKGLGIKASHLGAVYGCADCHRVYDLNLWDDSEREIIYWFLLRALYRTHVRMVEKRVLRVA